MRQEKTLSVKLCLDTYAYKSYPDLTKINFLCADNLIHIRFKKYSKEECIYGFEQKLTYLLTYLFTKNIYCKLWESDIDLSSFEDVWKFGLKYFAESSDYKTLLSCIEKKFPRCEGFNLKPLYSKINYERAAQQFGEIARGAYPTKLTPYFIEDEISLKTFLDVLKIDLDTYLFNDRYYLEIFNYSYSAKNVYDKFLNKYKNKLKVKTKRDKSFKEINLWK